MELVIEHLQKHFEGKLVLRDIHFRFEQGKIYGLLGRNGAGKTTLFNCINQDIEIDGGRFYIEDEGRRPVTMSDIGYVLSTYEQSIQTDYHTKKDGRISSLYRR